jgi:hypothetical protein
MDRMKLPDTQDINNGISNITENFEKTKESVMDNLNEFSSNVSNGANDTFLNSNSIIAKFTFVILVVIGFLLLLNLGTKLIFYFLEPSKNPYIVKGLVYGNSNIFIPQDPTIQNNPIVLRSNNMNTGLEFTWSVWIYVDKLDNDRYNHVFNKGNSTFVSSGNTPHDIIGLATINNAPGVYLKKTTEGIISLYVFMDTFNKNATDSGAAKIEVKNIPIKKWFHLVIRNENKIMDTYINGTISGRYNFENVPKQNNDNIYIGNNSGFPGKLSNLIYYDHALSVFDINNIILKGPDLTESKYTKANYGFYSYLSNLWYTSKL